MVISKWNHVNISLLCLTLNNSALWFAGKSHATFSANQVAVKPVCNLYTRLFPPLAPPVRIYFAFRYDWPLWLSVFVMIGWLKAFATEKCFSLLWWFCYAVLVVWMVWYLEKLIVFNDLKSKIVYVLEIQNASFKLVNPLQGEVGWVNIHTILFITYQGTECVWNVA